jgi:hypothetical protein
MGVCTPCSVDLRLVVLKDFDTGKRLGICTNNMAKPVYDIAWFMPQRWDKSENVSARELMASLNLNHHPGNGIKELEKQPLMDKPDDQKTVQTLKMKPLCLSRR